MSCREGEALPRGDGCDMWPGGVFQRKHGCGQGNDTRSLMLMMMMMIQCPNCANAKNLHKLFAGSPVLLFCFRRNDIIITITSSVAIFDQALSFNNKIQFDLYSSHSIRIQSSSIQLWFYKTQRAPSKLNSSSSSSSCE